jgi:hypothetical protein
VSIRLCDIPAEGDPAYLVYNHIKDFYVDYPAIFIDLQFNFETADGLEQYAGEVNRAVQRLASCVTFFFLCAMLRELTMRRYNRILVFLTTHSTPDTNLLWHAPKANGASTVAEVSTNLGAVA